MSLHGISYAADQLELFLKEFDLPDKTLSDKVLNLRLQILIGQGKFEELKEVLDHAEVSSLETEIRCLMSQGILANRNQDYRASLIYFLDAEAKAKDIKIDRLLAQVQINIGTVYAGLHHYQEGLDRYSVVLDKYSQLLGQSTRSALLHNLGNLNYALGDIPESIRCLKASIEFQNEALIDRSQLLLMRSQLAIDQTLSMDTFQIKDDHDLYPIYLYCQSFSEKGGERLTTLEKVAGLAQNGNDFKTELDALERIVDIHGASSDWELAFSRMEDFRSVEQSLLTIQQTAKLAEQAARYELAEKEQSIAVLRKETELQDEIVKRNDMLEVANEDLRQFAYVVSHDLKEPLRMIGAYTQLIELRMKDAQDPESKEYFNYVSSGVSRLNVLLDGLSNFSTLKSLQEQHEVQSLKDIIHTSIENLDVLIKETKTSISVESETEIRGSIALLVLLFQNLIQNAIKFRKKDALAHIHIRATEVSDKTSIEVSDNGIGIAENQRDRVFIIFQRLSRDHSDGSGMGLAICKKIVQLHHGRIYIKETTDKKGTTFCVELPK